MATLHITRRFIGKSIYGAVIAVGLATCCISIPAWSQSQSINGTMRGQVTDESGAAIPGATVSIDNPDVGYTNTITTGNDGFFVVPNLPLGNYKVAVSKAGFSTLTYGQISLSAGQEFVFTAKLKVGSANTTVEVNASASLIDPATLNLQRTLGSREVENLPLVSRNPYNFILFQPGISGHPNPELGIPRSLNTNGLLDRINYEMDGMVNTQSDRIGLRLFPIGNIFVKEVQTVSNSFAPEFGETSGDVYNVISNSGANTYHGVFQYIHRWVDATAYPFFSNHSKPKPDLQLTDYSANLGGFAIKNKLFFFGSYEKLTRGSPAVVTITPANIAALGIPADQVATSPGLLHGTFTLERVDWNINKKNSMFIRYNYFKNNFPFNTQVGGLNTISTAADFLDRAHVIAGQLTTTINDHALNELRFSWPMRNNQHFAHTPTSGPAIVVAGAANLGASSNAGDKFTDKVPSGSDNVNLIRGRHAIKFGFNYAERINRQRNISSNQYNFSSTTLYSAVQNYQRAQTGIDPYAYTSFSSQTDVAGIGYASQFLGAYVQDTWQISPRFLTIYGIRYDHFQGPKANSNALYPSSRHFNIPKTNFAPRLGMTYRAAENIIIKASVGMFYQSTPTNLWFNALSNDGSNQISVYTYSVGHDPVTGIGLPPAGAPAFPHIPSTTGNTQIQDVTTISPNFRNEYTWNATLQISQQLSQNDSILIGYVMANGRNLELQRNINLINPIGELADGRPIFGGCNPVGGMCSPTYRADPRFNNVSQVESGANSNFNALVLNYRHSFSRGIQINANYTWSHTLSNAPEVNTFEVSPSSSGIEDTTNLRRDYGNASVNRPNAFNLTAVLEPTFSLNNRFVSELANHNMLAILANISSGDQGSIFTGSAQNGDSTVTGITRPSFVARNTVRSPGVAQVDARYTRSTSKLFDRFAPEFFIEAQNIFNHTNVTSISTTQPVTLFNPLITGSNGGIPVGSPSISSGSVLEARIVQI
ncbi:MAG: TonB-dependent receptor domain-containing protein, partial [Edaphobacter sp.]